MTKSNIIVFPGTAAAEPVVQPQAVEGPRPSARKNLVTAVEAVVTAAIGICVITCTLAILAMV